MLAVREKTEDVAHIRDHVRDDWGLPRVVLRTEEVDDGDIEHNHQKQEAYSRRNHLHVHFFKLSKNTEN